MFGKGKLAMYEEDGEESPSESEGEGDTDTEEVDFNEKRAQRLMDSLGIKGSYADFKKLISICSEE